MLLSNGLGRGGIMKKALLFLLLAAALLIGTNYSYAVETKSSDYEVVQESNTAAPSDFVVIKETDTIQMIKSDNKIGIIDKKSGAFILKPIIDSIDNLQSNNDSEYKFMVQNHIGYVNTDSGVNFITNYDDIIPMDKYLKVKKDNKYGLIDKEGNIILKPLFQKVSVVYNDNKEYISGKYEGKYRMFYNTGNLIPDNELYTVEKEGNYLLAEDLKPIFKAYRQKNKTIYEKTSTAKDSMVYEIKEIPLPKKVNAAVIEKNEPFKQEEQNIFSVDNTEYVVVNNKGKIGLNNKKGKEIIPAVYKSISVKRPCEHSSKGIILASRNNTYTAYNKKGKIIAEDVYGKINVYKYGKVYSLTKENAQLILRANGRQIGILTVDDNGYEFTKTKFHPYVMHKVYELLILFFTIA